MSSWNVAKISVSILASILFSLLRLASRQRISTTVKSLIETGPCSLIYCSTSSDFASLIYHFARALVSKYMIVLIVHPCLHESASHSLFALGAFFHANLDEKVSVFFCQSAARGQ